MVSKRGSLPLQTCAHPGGWRGGFCPQQHQSWNRGARTHGCAVYGPSVGGGVGVSTVGMLAPGPLLGVGEKGTDMAGTRGSDHALEAC